MKLLCKYIVTGFSKIRSKITFKINLVAQVKKTEIP